MSIVRTRYLLIGEQLHELCADNAKKDYKY
jgi:hypothetical protein